MVEKGDADAQYQLGRMYASGSDVARNDRLASQSYQKATRQGHGIAQYCLGKGDIWYSSDKEGLKWCRMAAVQGYSEAQRNLAVCYGMEFNCLLSFLWHYKAAKQGNAYSLFKAAYLFCSNRTMLSGLCNYTDPDYYNPNIYSFKDYYYEFYTKPHMVSYNNIRKICSFFSDIKANDIEAIENKVIILSSSIDESVEENHNVKCPVYRNLILPNETPSLLQIVPFDSVYKEVNRETEEIEEKIADQKREIELKTKEVAERREALKRRQEEHMARYAMRKAREEQKAEEERKRAELAKIKAGIQEAEEKERKRIDALKLLAVQGDVEAQFSLGEMLLLNRKARNSQEAYRYLKLAALQGHGIAKCYLGIIHEYGLCGLEPCVHAAIFFYENADKHLGLRHLLFGVQYLMRLKRSDVPYEVATGLFEQARAREEDASSIGL
ncbi:MAG: hypothetical protein K2Q33_09240, partial [Gammaproteobacteria bacterium]|nr:hypothetical protein [Gammaproteobacteria bacterium]